MKRIEYRDQTTGKIRVAATNGESEGFFVRGEHENSWTQTQGTLSRRYRNRAAFIRELKRRGMVLPDESNITSEYGWDE